MAKQRSRRVTKKSIETFIHGDASRRYIPTAEYQSVLDQDEQTPIQVVYKRRNRDLDPQLVWPAARTSRTGPIWWSRRRHCTSRRRCTLRC